jgi:hypothetical protein
MFNSFTQSLQTNAGILPPLGHEHILPNPFQLTHPPYHPTVYSLRTEEVGTGGDEEYYLLGYNAV